jgi:TP901 family phage tail tape measure protein
LAGSQKEFELLFKLKASLGGNFNSTFKSAISANNQLQNSLKNVNSLQSKIDGFSKQSTAIEKNKQKLAELNAEHDRLQQELSQTGEPTEALRKKLEKNENQIQQTTAKIEEQTSKLDSYKQELKEAGINTDNLEEANGRLQKSYEKLKTSQETLQAINNKQQEIKASIASTKTQLAGTIGTITAVAAAVYAGPVKSAQDYETAMAKVGTIADTQAVPLEKMSGQIMALSNQTGIAATAIADDVYNAISAGQSTADAVNFVTNSTKLAKAGFAESSQTLDVLTTILNAYGKSADEVGAVSDMLIQIQNKGKVTVAELSSVMGKIIPTANANGVSLEQLGAGYAIMTSKGIAAAETTTYMNSMLNELGKSGTSADKLLRSTTGSSFKELMASGKSLGDVLGILQQAAEESGKSLSDVFGSAEAGKAAVSLLSNGVDGFNESVQGMIDSAGATDAAFAQMENTTEAKMAKAKNSITNLGIVLGQNLLPIVGQLADKVAVAVTKISEFAQANPKVVQTVLKVVAGLAALKVGMLTTKLFTLSAQDGILSLAGKLVGLRGRLLENAATSVSFATKMKTAGSGVLKYFSNVKGALGGVGSAIGNVFSGSTIIGKVSGLLGGVKSTIFGGISGLAGKAAGLLTGTGSKMLGFLLKPFTAIGGRLGGILSGLGGVIARSPLGTIGKVIGGGFSKLTGLIAPVGNAIKTVLGPLGKLGSTILGPLGGIAGKILPVVGVVTTIITVFQMVKNHLEEIRGFIQKTFGDEALAVFDKIVEVVTNIGNTIKGVFSDGNIGAARDKIQEIFGDKGVAVFDTLVKVLGVVKNAVSDVVAFVTEHIVPVAEQIFTVLVTQIIPGIVGVIQAAAPTIMAIIQSIADFIGAIIPVIASFIAGLMPIISEIINFISTYVLPIISEVFTFITGTVLPIISAAIQAILPVVVQVLSTLLPAIQTAVTTIWNVVSPIIQGILSAIQFVMPTILSIIQTVIGTITGVIQGLMSVLSGIITFITGVFTGNWSQAWEGIKSIFSGIFEAIVSVCKGVINGIISAVNVVIRGLNKLKVPDWVPGIGGKGINISEIPMLAKGSKNTPDTFIAGEKGPELITNAAGMTVFTASQTRDIMQSQNAAAQTAATVQAMPAVDGAQAQTVNNYQTAPEVASGTGSNGKSNNITINNNPTIVVNGDTPDDLDAKLEENNRKLLRDVKDMMEEEEDNERRQKYE